MQAQYSVQRSDDGGLVSRYYRPMCLGREIMLGTEALHFHYHRLRHELSNYSVRRIQNSDGAIVSMHQSGTHWLKFMLATAMSDHYAIPPPQYNHANDIIGGSKDLRRHADIPHLISSHSIPPLVMRNLFVLRFIASKPTVILVRDIRHSLYSNYMKWRARYAVSFSTYLRGDPAGKRYNSDIWWCVRFLNAWGRVHSLIPEQFHIVRYERLVDNPAHEIANVADHLGLPLSARSVAVGVAAATKPAMAARSDPARPPGEVQLAAQHPLTAYQTADREFLRQRLERYLKRPFGYDYNVWESD